jgi:uncharacterized membrane protein
MMRFRQGETSGSDRRVLDLITSQPDESLFMTWFTLALAVPALLTIVNFVDKYLVEGEVRDFRAMPIFAGIAGLLVALMLMLAGVSMTVTDSERLILILSGISVIFGAAFYFQAISLEHTSTIIVTFQVMPVMALLISFVFFNETIGGGQFIGFWLIMAATLGISLQPGEGKLRVSLAFWLMMLVAFIVAVRSVVISQYVSADLSFLTTALYMGIGQGIGAVLLYAIVPAFRRGFNTSFVSVRKPLLIVILISESAFVIAEGLRNLALTLSPSAALVNVVGGVQVFYGIFLGWLLTRLFPRIFKEATARNDLLRKIGFGILLFIGLWLVVTNGA